MNDNVKKFIAQVVTILILFFLWCGAVWCTAYAAKAGINAANHTDNIRVTRTVTTQE